LSGGGGGPTLYRKKSDEGTQTVKKRKRFFPLTETCLVLLGTAAPSEEKKDLAVTSGKKGRSRQDRLPGGAASKNIERLL